MPRELRPGQSSLRVVANHLDVFVKPEKKGGKQRPIFRPSWDFSVLVFRPIPYYDQATNTFSPLTNGDQLGDWYASGFLVGIVNSGRRSARCILVHRAESIDVATESPIYMVSEYLSSYKRVKNLLAAGKKSEAAAQLRLLNRKVWELYSADNNTNVEARNSAFLQCPVLAARSKAFDWLLGTGKDDPLPLVLLIGSAMTAVEEALVIDDPNSDVKFKNVIDFKSGQFIEIGRKGYNKREWFPTTGTPAENYYSARTFEKYHKYTADVSRYEAIFKDKIRPWEELFVLPDAEEQIVMMVWVGINPVYLYMALGDNYRLPDVIIKRARQALGEQVFTGANLPPKQTASFVPEDVGEESDALPAPFDSEEVPSVSEQDEHDVPFEMPVNNSTGSLFDMDDSLQEDNAPTGENREQAVNEKQVQTKKLDRATVSRNIKETIAKLRERSSQ